MAYSLGSPLTLGNGQSGVVRYSGPVAFDEGIWVGVELDTPSGRHDGAVSGMRYFHTRPNHGVFVRSDSIPPPRRTGAPGAPVYAASVLPVSDTRLSAFRHFDYFESLHEQDHCKSAEELTRLQSGQQGQFFIGSSPAEWRRQLDTLPEPGAAQPSLRWPLTQEQVLSLADSLLVSPNQLLSKKHVWRLILELLETYDRAPSVIDLQSPQGGRLVVVGDTHGQLNDVFWIFKLYGFPSPTNRFLFNGDIADRGQNAVEIFILLAAFKVLYPDSVHINRGNHESEAMNERDKDRGGGFREEVTGKYCLSTFKLFQALFAVLPVASIINGHTIVLHGGLPKPNVSLQQIRQLDRRNCPDHTDPFQSEVFTDIMWSDPVDMPGCLPNANRGCGNLFGFDATASFLAGAGLRFLIRSHEVPKDMRGCAVQHNGQCVTVFSASNYCGVTGNAGGVALFSAATDAFQLQDFMSPPLQEQATMMQAEKAALEASEAPTVVRPNPDAMHALPSVAVAPGQLDVQAAAMESEVVAQVKKRICEAKGDLQRWYAQHTDLPGSTVVSVAQWQEGLISILDPGARHLDFTRFLPQLAEVEPDGHIDYRKFLNSYRLQTDEKYAGWQQQVLAQVWNALMALDLGVQDTIRAIDPSGDGLVSMSEFEGLLHRCQGTLTEAQLASIVRVMYPRGTEQVRVADFIAKFNSFHSAYEKPKDPMIEKLLQHIGSQIKLAGGDSLEGAFKYIDSDMNGFISFDEFIHAVRGCWGIQDLSDSDIELLAAHVDRDRNGRINYLEFVSAFSEPDPDALAAADSIVQDVTRLFYKKKPLLVRAFSNEDYRGSGFVDDQSFRRVLEYVNQTLPNPISQTQLDTVVAHVPKENRLVDYMAFLNSIHVCDVRVGNSPPLHYATPPGGQMSPVRTTPSSAQHLPEQYERPCTGPDSPTHAQPPRYEDSLASGMAAATIAGGNRSPSNAVMSTGSFLPYPEDRQSPQAQQQQQQQLSPTYLEC